jgi:hypothetical protein
LPRHGPVAHNSIHCAAASQQIMLHAFCAALSVKKHYFLLDTE